MISKYLGRYFTLILIIVTTTLYFFSKPIDFNFFLHPWLYLSQLLALIGATLFSLNYLLSTRSKILESLFGGLDKLYHFHHFIGTTAFVLMINHPLFLAINALPNLILAKNYLFISRNLYYNFGVFALYSFILILLFTFIIKLPYQNWLLSHRLLGLPLILTLAHVFFISSDTSRYLPLRLWILFLLTVALWSYFYKLFFYPKIGPKFSYQISKINNLGDIVEIYLQPLSAQLKHHPGQFVFVKFLDLNFSSELHPFSISSPPSSEILRLSIKRIGDFTGKIDKLAQNSPVIIYGPYGKFFTNFVQNQPIVCLAGGIGITPFLSLLAHEQKNPTKRSIDLYYCVKYPAEAVYLSELESYQRKLKKFKLHLIYSQKQGYLTASSIKTDLSYFLKSKFYLCGPKSFMLSLQHQLSQLKVKSSNIIFEDFSLHDSH